MFSTLLLMAAASLPQQSFPALVWRERFPGEALPDELVRDFGGVNVEGPDDAQWTLENNLSFYVGHAPGRDALHIDSEREWYATLWQDYWDSRDPAALVRVPCLSEASTQTALEQVLIRSIHARAGQHGLGLSLGDEVSLTPWGAPIDLCHSVACRENYGRFLRDTPLWSNLLPAKGQAIAYPDTDSTRLAWVRGDPQHVGAWLARRAFHHEVLRQTLSQLAAATRRESPGTAVGLFGQSGRTAFGDVGVEDVLPFLDFLEVYRLRDSRELFYTLRKPEQRSYLTLFRDPKALHGPAWIAWEHWLRGGNGVLLWSDRELLEQPPYHKRMARAVRDIRAVHKQLPDWAPRPGGVALLHAPDALALSWLRDALHDGPTWMRRFASYQTEHGTREVLLRAMLRLLEDLGTLPGALPLEQVDGKTALRFGQLVAPHLLIVSEEEEARLRAHLESGGRLLVLGDLGTHDRRGAALERDLFASLHGAHPKQVKRLDLDGKRYLAERQSGKSNYATRMQAAVSEYVPSDPIPSWSIRPLQEGPGFPWLRVQQYEQSSESWLCVALPNAAAPEQRAALAPLRVQLQGIGEFEVEWIHPAGAASAETPLQRELPAGDALVFRLR
ncbi:MAG: hypothetical protein ACI9F9_001630 [Candidatus Paceibacteria bacterium]